MNLDAAVQLSAVSKRFGSVTAVDSVDLEVARGEFLTLLGASGSGKSTVLMMIAGFERPDAGRILIEGKDLARIPPHHRRIGIVFQSYALFPHLTVFENLAYGLRNLRWRQSEIDARVAELLALVRLEGTEGRLPSQLSGGQQQRVALARALAFRPSVLLLDEPLGALDRKLREHMLAEFQRIHRSLGTTMIFVTHDQEEALAMSDRIAVMERGRIVQVDRPVNLYERPLNAFVADFVGDSNLLDGIAGPGGTVRLDCGWTVECPHDAAAGTAVHLLVRPERINIGPGPNQITGTVEQRLYLGQTTRLTVRGSHGGVLQVRTLSRAESSFEPGDAVTLSWPASAGRILSKGDLSK